MARIFVSYRRDDAETEAGRITDWLDRHFGEAEVFMDINTIGPGDFYKTKIKETVDSIDALVAVIGKSWLEIADNQGRRRLDDPNDILRLEIVNALERGILVVPVRVQGAGMPHEDDLPGRLKPLVERNALELSNLNWKPGMEKLITALDSVVSAKTQPVVEPEPEPEPEPAGKREPWPGMQRKRPVAVEPEPEVADRRQGLGAWQLSAGLAGAALLLAGLFVKDALHEWFIHPGFGGPASFHDSEVGWRLAGVFTSLATVGIAGVAVAGLLLARRPAGGRPLAAGLVVAAGLQGTALYAGVLTAPKGHEVGFVLPLVGGLLVLAVGAWLLRALLSTARGTPDPPFDAGVRVAAAAGAVGTVVGMAVDFNRGGSFDQRHAASVLSPAHVERWDLFLVALLALAIAVALPRLPGSRSFAAGVLIACGVACLCLWPRYIAIPFLELRDISRPGAGGFIGLAGAALITFAGFSARRALRRQVAT